MFTGIITDLGTLIELEKGPIWRVRIKTTYDTEGIELGASIACSGICLSVVAKDTGWVEFEAGDETQKATNLHLWKIGDKINLERALKIGDELGGHIVTGHVDGTGILIGRETSQGTLLLEIEAPSRLAYFIATKGSVTVNGVSLTVNRIEDHRFGVGLIPITVEKTNLGQAQVGDQLNLEIDVLARYVARLNEEPK